MHTNRVKGVLNEREYATDLPSVRVNLDTGVVNPLSFKSATCFDDIWADAVRQTGAIPGGERPKDNKNEQSF